MNRRVAFALPLLLVTSSQGMSGAAVPSHPVPGVRPGTGTGVPVQADAGAASQPGDLSSGKPRPARVSLGDSSVSHFGDFGQPALTVGGRNGVNAIVGIVDNEAPPGTSIFPTGVTGYGRMNSRGGQVFGLFGRADLMAPGTATNEMNSFNYCGPPSAVLPPKEEFGTAECNAITAQLVPYGQYDSSIGLQWGVGVGGPGNKAVHYRAAAYMRPGSFTDVGLLIDGEAGDAANAISVKRGGAGQHLALWSVGTPHPDAVVISHTGATGVQGFSVRQSGAMAARDVTLMPTNHAELSTPVAGRMAYCADCFVPGTRTRGTVVFGNGSTWLAVSAAEATH